MSENKDNASLEDYSERISCEPTGHLEFRDAEDDPYDLYDHITWRKPKNLGLFYDKILQAFTHKIVFMKVASYPFFGVYLNTPGHMYAALTSIFPMFWSLKFFWGFLSDSKPIFGRNRIYYMAIGWLISAVAYGVVSCVPYPEPYYAVKDCEVDRRTVANPDAPTSGMVYVAIMSFGVFGVGITDLASDALVVDYVKMEPAKHRGKSNVFAQIFSILGAVILFMIVGIMLNSPAYGGWLCNLPFTYQHILIIYFIVSILGIFNSCFLTFETRKKVVQMKVSTIVQKFWEFMHLRLFQRCAVIFLVVPALFNAKSSAIVKIRKNWAKVDPIMGAFNGVVMALLVVFGMYLVQKYFLGVSWKKVFWITKLYVVCVALIVEAVTIFDILRSQYFYFAEDLLSSVAHAVNMYIMLQLAAEISEVGLEALTFGMLMTNWTISSSLAVIIGNLISVPFDVVSDERYLSDTDEDRWRVFGSVFFVCCANLLCIPVFLYLSPEDRGDVALKKEQLGKSKFQAKLYFVCFCVGYFFIFLFNLLIMIPSTQCLQILGGQGC